MRNVFVYQFKDKWKVIDKATKKVIDIVDDVLIFNGIYKRYNGKRGWHGVLSEEINHEIIHLLDNNYWRELIQQVKPYYPRALYCGEFVSTRKAKAVHFRKDVIKVYSINNQYQPYEIADLCQPWKPEEIEDDPWEDYNDEQFDDEDDYDDETISW
jgi:hypothetical protein